MHFLSLSNECRNGMSAITREKISALSLFSPLILIHPDASRKKSVIKLCVKISLRKIITRGRDAQWTMRFKSHAYRAS